MCAVWAGNRAVKGICAISLFVTAGESNDGHTVYTSLAHGGRDSVFVSVTIGRLEIMKSPPTRLAVMFFVEPDGIGAAVSVFVSNVVAAVLLGLKIR